MTVTVVVPPEPRTKPGILASLINPAWSAGSAPVEGLYAEVETGGLRLCVSRLPGETTWTADAAYRTSSSCPIFSNGYGARYLRTKVLQPDVAAALDRA